MQKRFAVFVRCYLIDGSRISSNLNDAMRKSVQLILFLNVLLLLGVQPPRVGADEAVALGGGQITSADWPCWRGPGRDGVASPDQAPPTSWSDTENVLWRAPVPGRGHGSPTVLGGQVFLATADQQRDGQFVLCVDRNTGESVWETMLHQGGLEHKGKRKPNEKASLASSTVATNGDLLYINLLNDGAVWTSALSLEGDVVWQKRLAIT